MQSWDGFEDEWLGWSGKRAVHEDQQGKWGWWQADDGATIVAIIITTFITITALVLLVTITTITAITTTSPP